MSSHGRQNDKRMNWIGMWSEHAALYLQVLSLITLLAFSLPIFLMPAKWAGMLQWKLPEDTDLCWYFARCLGSFALVTNLFFLRAAWTGFGTEVLMQFFAAFCLMMVLVHIWGALERTQPWTETAEIGLWLAFLVLTLLCLPGTH